MIKKIYAANLALFAVVVGMVALLMTESHTVPPAPPAKLTKPAGENTDQKIPQPEKTYAHLGTVPIFDTIIPKPTPVPTPVPTKPPDPELEKAISGWKLTAALPGGTAFFEDKRTKEEWSMKIGEVRAVKYGKWTMDVKLESIDEGKFTGTVVYEGEQGKQTKTLSMFDQ